MAVEVHSVRFTPVGYLKVVLEPELKCMADILLLEMSMALSTSQQLRVKECLL